MPNEDLKAFMSGEERVTDNTSTHSSSLLSAAAGSGALAGGAVAGDEIPAAPWHLGGAALGLPHLSWSQRPFGVLALVHYDTSPVGAYNELALAVLTRRGPTVLQMPVTSKASMIGGRRIWGFPKTLANLQWRRNGERIVFTAGTKQWHAQAVGPRIPLRLRASSTQQLNGEWVRVPLQITAQARLAWCGRRFAILLESFDMVVHPPLNQTGKVL
ncbi:MAG TPA: acetoacetate decarboxylase family protein [Abditibacteriaceae bacterium]